MSAPEAKPHEAKPHEAKPHEAKPHEAKPHEDSSEGFRAARRAAGISPRALIGGLFALLGLQNVLLWLFLGWNVAWVVLAGLAALAAMLPLIVKCRGWAPTEPIAPRVLAVAFAVSLVLFLLGGEGRFFYANTDWQVRGAVLRDMVAYPWPFTYDLASDQTILRLPMGMYLLPALVGKLAGGRAAEIAMLLQNSAMLSVVLSLGSLLFRTGRQRLFALLVFVGFSGLDVIGAWAAGQRLDIHLEQWAGLQYSAHVTQAFWVPQHALAGWIGAVLYLLWRDGKAPPAVFLAALPLVALTSPLALMGLVPFAAHAGIEGLLGRRFGIVDFALLALALALAIPALLFLTAGSGAVGGGLKSLPPGPYIRFLVIEVVPFLFAVRLANSWRFGGVAMILTTAVLVLAPWIQVGQSVDFVMRASIPALAILAVMVAAIFTEPAPGGSKRKARWSAQRPAQWLAGAALIVGAVTPATEIIRALRFPASPAALCSYYGVVPDGADTYVAPVGSLGGLVAAGKVTVVDPVDPAICWDGLWPAGEADGLFDPIPDVPPMPYVP